MQRRQQQAAGGAKSTSPKVRSAQSKVRMREVPAKAQAPEPLVVGLKDDNFSRLLMHDDVDLLNAPKREDGHNNYAEQLKGNLAVKRKLSDRAIALAKKRAKRVQKIKKSPRNISIVDSIFRPTKKIELSEDEDIYFGKEGQVKIDYSVMQTAPLTRYSLLVFFFCVGLALYVGWRLRTEELLTAESGWGYRLGIIGASMMLILVFYPMRKKFAFMKYFGPIKFWFIIHMVFGTLGPTLILFHANFGVGSLNSQVALAFTLLVASSGFFHMFIYSKVHYHLHGKKMTLQELQDKTEVNRSSLQHIFDYAPKLKQRLNDFEEDVLTPPHSVLASVLRLLTIGFRTLLNYLIITRGLKRGLRVVFQRAGWPESELAGQHKSNKRVIKAHMRAILKIVELTFYERLFAQWYLFHGPLFFMLIFVAIIHVIAVHMY